ncbi:MAG TPA: DUF5658 family protein [Ktedonobacterales bacterium]|nr:DUF5658 family protein [Ktedonobacterales bacterium]
MILRSAARRERRIPFWSLFWLALFAVLNACDLLTTYIDLQAGMREGNPLMRALLNQAGFSALILYKVLMVFVVSAGILMLNRSYPLLARAALAVCNILVLVVVLSNFIQYQL